jgi:dihydropyrimidinase
MSTGAGSELVKQAQARGVPVLAETCVQYLVLDDSVFDRDDGHLYACCPQVKKKTDIERLWHGLDKEVSVVSTDTCSFTREQKAMWWQGDAKNGYGDWTRIPMGLPGLDTLVPLMYTLGVRTGRISHNQLVRLCASRPARVMGLSHRKGSLRPGCDADIVVIDPREERVVTPGETLQSACDWSPYAGMKLSGFAKHTLVRGRAVVRDGKVIGTPGHGKFVERGLPIIS